LFIDAVYMNNFANFDNRIWKWTW